MMRIRERDSPFRHAGQWVVIDAQFRLLSIGSAAYPGTSPIASVDQIARRVLLPRMRAGSMHGRSATAVVEDHGRRWNVRVEPVVGAVHGKPMALVGCYWRARSPMPERPQVGCWELRVTPPGPDQSMRAYWSPSLFGVLDRVLPAGNGPYGMDGVQWLDEVVVVADRAETRWVQEDLVSAASDIPRFHTFRIHGQTGRVHRVRSAIWRDISEPGPDVWLRGVSMRVASSDPGTAAGRVATRYLETMFTLGPDPVCAIDANYEQLFLTTPRFAELGVVLPADRHLPRMCHPDDMAAVRAMLTEATTSLGALAGPVPIRFAGKSDWITLELVSAGVPNSTMKPRHVLCWVRRQHLMNHSPGASGSWSARAG